MFVQANDGIDAMLVMFAIHCRSCHDPHVRADECHFAITARWLWCHMLGFELSYKHSNAANWDELTLFHHIELRQVANVRTYVVHT